MNLNISHVNDAVAHCGDIWQEFAGCNVFLTGGTGFLGRWVLATLLEGRRLHGLDFTVACLTRDPNRFRSDWPSLAGAPGVVLVPGDVRDFPFPAGEYRYVIHAAADTSARADSLPFELLASIVDGMRRIVEFAEYAGCKRLLFTSSGAVYGPQPAGMDAIPETYLGACPTTDIRSNYGQSKRLAEQICTIANSRPGIETVIARCFAFAGAGLDVDGHFAIGNFVRDAVLGRTITVGGDGTPLRSYLDASDTAAWLLRLLVRGRAGEAYNVGSSRALSIEDLARKIETLIPTARGVAILGTASAGANRSRYIPNVQKAREEIGLEEWTGIDTAILRLAEWVRGLAPHKT